MASSFRNILTNAALQLARRGDLRRLIAVVTVDGIEVTQAIQYYRSDQHLTDSADQGPDNSITLIANKPALVRVYVRTLFGDREVTGRLIVERRMRWVPTPLPGLTLDPIAPVTTVASSNPDYQSERETLGDTLNFLIPAETMAGNIKLTAQIWPVNGGNPDDPADSHETSVSAHLQQTLALRGILISYDGPDAAGTGNLSLAAPTIADLQTTAALSLASMPVGSEPSVSSAGDLAWDTPLTGVATTPGGCSVEWYALNAALAEVKANDGNRTDVIYYGLLPTGIPIVNVGGCASNGVTSGGNGDGVTMAHEIGHACGLGHAPCNTPGDAEYPAYEPYDAAASPSGSLGEYGLNINNLMVRLPAEKDVMGYCNGVWFSLYHYQRLVSNTVLHPKWPAFPRAPKLVDPYVFPWEELIPPHPEWDYKFEKLRARPLISVIGILTEEDAIDVLSVTRVNALAALPGGTPSAYSVQLVGEGGDLLAEAPLMEMPAQGACRCSGCGGDGKRPGQPPYSLQAMMPDVAPGSEIRIVRRDPVGSGEPTKETRRTRIIWSRKAPATRPRIGGVKVDIKKDGTGILRWSGERGAEPIRHSIQFSKDGGKSWNSLASRVKGDSFRFGTSSLPSGDLLFRVLAHDGFHTATATSPAVALRPRPPIPTILHPGPRSLFAAGQIMRLWGSTVLRDPDERAETKYRWLVDGREVGNEADLWIAAPAGGRHSCELIVESRGGSARAAIDFETVGGETSGETKRRPK